MQDLKKIFCVFTGNVCTVHTFPVMMQKIHLVCCKRQVGSTVASRSASPRYKWDNDIEEVLSSS